MECPCSEGTLKFKFFSVFSSIFSCSSSWCLLQTSRHSYGRDMARSHESSLYEQGFPSLAQITHFQTCSHPWTWRTKVVGSISLFVRFTDSKCWNWIRPSVSVPMMLSSRIISKTSDCIIVMLQRICKSLEKTSFWMFTPSFIVPTLLFYSLCCCSKIYVGFCLLMFLCFLFDCICTDCITLYSAFLYIYYMLLFCLISTRNHGLIFLNGIIMNNLRCSTDGWCTNVNSMLLWEKTRDELILFNKMHFLWIFENLKSISFYFQNYFMSINDIHFLHCFKEYTSSSSFNRLWNTSSFLEENQE